MRGSFRLEIVSLDYQSCGIILNGRFFCEASFPIQEEWLMQALFSALRRGGYEPSQFFSHQNVIPSKVIPFRRKEARKETEETSLTLEDLGL